MPLGTTGKYERLEVLGHGASGIVYLAKDILLGRRIALKEIAASGEDRERVLEEARVLDRLRHPNIVHVYGVDEIDKKIILEMEYVAGENLQDVLQKSGRVPPVDAIEIAAQICDGLSYAHQNHVVHRDIKPANILIDNEGTVKLVDFGLAQVLGTHSFAGGAGTYAYMAPEDFHEESLSDHQADIWAVGVVLYEMLTGRRPFQAVKSKDPFSWKRAIEDAPLIPARDLNPQVSQSLDVIISRALAREKTDRYSSASALALDLRSINTQVSNPSEIPEIDNSSAHLSALQLPDGKSLTNIEDFIQAAPDEWPWACSVLQSGQLADWLLSIEESPLAVVARDLAADTVRTIADRLRDFLYRAGLDTETEAYRAYERGGRHARAGRFVEAAKAFRRATVLNPGQIAYFEEMVQALREQGLDNEADGVLADAHEHHPQRHIPAKRRRPVTGLHAELSADFVDFGRLRWSEQRSKVVVINNPSDEALSGRVISAPEWVHVEPLTFRTRRRQKLKLSASPISRITKPTEMEDSIILEVADERVEITTRVVVIPDRRTLGGIYWWYLPILFCCLLPSLAGENAGRVGPQSSGDPLAAPGMAASTLLLGSLFAITCAADVLWALRLLILLFLGVTACGAIPLIGDWVNSTDILSRTIFVQTSTPALVMLILQSASLIFAPERWGRWRLWAWITGATAVAIAAVFLQIHTNPNG